MHDQAGRCTDNYGPVIWECQPTREELRRSSPRASWLARAKGRPGPGNQQAPSSLQSPPVRVIRPWRSALAVEIDRTGTSWALAPPCSASMRISYEWDPR